MKEENRKRCEKKGKKKQIKEEYQKERKYN